MQGGFLSPQEQTVCSGLMGQLHTTFSRPLIIFKTAREIQVYSNPNYNFAYRPAPNNLNIETITESGVFNCRIMYGDNVAQLNRMFSTQNTQDGGDDELRLDLKKALVRIKFEICALPFFEDVKKATIDNVTFEPFSSIKKHSYGDAIQFGTMYFRQTT